MLFYYRVPSLSTAVLNAVINLSSSHGKKELVFTTVMALKHFFLNFVLVSNGVIHEQASHDSKISLSKSSIPWSLFSLAKSILSLIFGINCCSAIKSFSIIFLRSCLSSPSN
jgi:hypothetical protein